MDLKAFLRQAPRGTATSIATALRVSPVMLSQWASGTKRVPAEHCPAISRATAGAVTCEELRSDVDWAYLREQASPAAEVAA